MGGAGGDSTGAAPLGAGGPSAQKPKGSAGAGGVGGPSGGAGAPAGGTADAAPAKKRGGHRGKAAAADDSESSDDKAPEPAAAAADPDTSPEVASVTPVLGTPRLSNPVPSGDSFALDPNQPPSVPTYLADTNLKIKVNNKDVPVKAIEFTTKIDIDADGDGGWYLQDKTDKMHGNDGSKTAARYPNGDSLNPAKIPYVVIPLDFGRTHPGVQMGDYVAVSYGVRTVYAIVGDKGPKGVLGEGSIALARNLKIPSNPNTGGVRSGVTYVILPGTKDASLPRTAAEIQAQGAKLFAQAGIPPV
jgi:hypothetical protein